MQICHVLIQDPIDPISVSRIRVDEWPTVDTEGIDTIGIRNGIPANSIGIEVTENKAEARTTQP